MSFDVPIAAMARSIRDNGHSRVVEQGHVVPLNTKAFTLSEPEDAA